MFQEKIVTKGPVQNPTPVPKYKCALFTIASVETQHQMLGLDEWLLWKWKEHCFLLYISPALRMYDILALRKPLKHTGPWFNIKMSSYQYRKSHCGDKTILRPSYLHNGISYTGKMSSLYWIRVQVSLNGFSTAGMCFTSLGQLPIRFFWCC